MQTLTRLPDWLEKEMKVTAICAEIEDNGWLADRSLIEKHINTLDLMIVALEQAIMPLVPLFAVCHEQVEKRDEDSNVLEYKYLKKPFMKSGKWAAYVEKLWPEYTQHKPYGGEKCIEVATGKLIKFSVGGVFTRVGFEKIKLTSDQQVKKYLLSLGWQPTEWNISKKGVNKGKVTSPKITEESFESIDSNVGQLIAQHIKANHRRSQLEGWLKAIRPDGRIPMVINPQGTPTGRATHQTIVNVPSEDKAPFFAKEMRSVFIAPPGYVLVGCDSMSDQVRKLCHYMGDAEFTKAVLEGKKEDGTDIHSFNMNKANLPSRGHAKNFFYGAIMFRAGDLKTGKLLKISGNDEQKKRAGKKAKDDYFKQLPKIKELIDGLDNAYKNRGFLLALDGRPLFPRKPNDTMAYLIQGAEAVMMKLALCYAYMWVKAEFPYAKMIAWVHDEYTWECLPEHAERIKFLSEEAIRQSGRDLNLTVASDGEGKIGKNWLEIH